MLMIARGAYRHRQARLGQTTKKTAMLLANWCFRARGYLLAAHARLSGVPSRAVMPTARGVPHANSPHITPEPSRYHLTSRQPLSRTLPSPARYHPAHRPTTPYPHRRDTLLGSICAHPTCRSTSIVSPTTHTASCYLSHTTTRCCRALRGKAINVLGFEAPLGHTCGPGGVPTWSPPSRRAAREPTVATPNACLGCLTSAASG